MLSVGMAHILHRIDRGSEMTGLWCHLTVVLEAPLIPSVVDAVTRTTRFQVSDTLGNLFLKFKSPPWWTGAWGVMAVIVVTWGSLLLMGVTNS